MMMMRSSSSMASFELTFNESLCTTVDCCSYSAKGKHRVEKLEKLYELYVHLTPSRGLGWRIN